MESKSTEPTGHSVTSAPMGLELDIEQLNQEDLSILYNKSLKAVGQSKLYNPKTWNEAVGGAATSQLC